MPDSLPVAKCINMTAAPEDNYITHAFSLGTSIWLLVETDTWPVELMEYDCITDTFNELIPSPVQVTNPNVCTYKNDTIVIVDNERGIITFNINTKRFSEPIKIPDIGNGVAVIAVGNYIHIFHGDRNPSCDVYGEDAPHKYIVFSMKDEVVKTFREQNCTSNTIGMQAIQHDRIDRQRTNTLIAGLGRILCKRDIAEVIVSLIFKYLKITEFYKFGGYLSDSNGQNWSDSFFIGTMQDKYGAVPLRWTKTPKYSRKTKEHVLISTNNVFQSDGNIVFIGLRSDSIYISIIDANGEQQLMRRSLSLPTHEIRAIALDYQRKLHLFGIRQLAQREWKQLHNCILLQVIIDNVVG